MEFNEQQKAALEAPTPVLVNAGAGSGKTRVLVERYIRFLLEHRNLSVNNVLAITFTNKAAAEMKERIRTRLSELNAAALPTENTFLSGLNENIPFAYVSTIHSFCSRILGECAIEAEVTPGFTVLEPMDSDIMIFELIEKYVAEISRDTSHPLYSHLEFLFRYGNAKRTFEALVALFTNRKVARDWALLRSAQSPEAVIEEWNTLLKQIGIPALNGDEIDNLAAQVSFSLAKLYLFLEDNYKNEKRHLRQLDMDDLLLHVENLLRTDPEVRKRLCDRFHLILLDEFQDIDPLQWHILRLLHANPEHTDKLFAVGDPKQSIYSFRRADIRILTSLQESLSQTGSATSGTEITMNRNYRSMNTVLGVVNGLFERVMDRKENGSQWEVDYVPVISERECGTFEGKVDLLITEIPENVSDYAPAYDAHDFEALSLATHIQHLVNKERISHPRDDTHESSNLSPVEYGDIAILIRRRTHLDTIEKALKDAEIPFQTVAGIGLFFRQELWDLYNLMRFLANPADDIALAGVLRSPLCTLSDDVLLRLSRGKGDNLWEKMKNCDHNTNTTGISTPYLPRVRFIHELLQNLLSIAKRAPLAVLLQKALLRTGLLATLSTQPDGEQMLANIEKLLSLTRAADQSGKMTLGRFVERLERYLSDGSEPEAQLPSPQNNMVTIMTNHNAKGLEFPVVMLPFLSEDLVAPAGKVLWDPDLDIGIKLLDPTSGFTKEESPSIRKRIDELRKMKELAEAKRLFYVAATRAKDYLILLTRVSREKKRNRKNVTRWDWVSKAFSIIPDNLTNGTIMVHHDGKDFPLELYTYTHERPYQISTHTVQGDKEALAARAAGILDARKRAKPGHYPSYAPLEPAPEKFLLSVTSMIEFIKCPMRYYTSKTAALPMEIGGWDEIMGQGKAEGKERRLALLEGTVVHTAMEIMDAPQGDNLEDLLRNNLEKEIDLTENEKAHLTEAAIKAVDAFKKNPIYDEIAASEHVTREATYTALLDEHFGIIAKIDLAFVDVQRRWNVLDFKTGKSETRENKQLSESYTFQALDYAMCFAKMYPRQQEFPVHFYTTEDDQIVSETYNQTRLKVHEHTLFDLITRIETFERAILKSDERHFKKIAALCRNCPQATKKCLSIDAILNLLCNKTGELQNRE